MESSLFKFIGDTLRSPSRMGIFVVVVLLIVFALTKLLPIWLEFIRSFTSAGEKSEANALAALERGHNAAFGLIREEMASARSQGRQQYVALLKQATALSKQGDVLVQAVENLRELLARTASMDGRMTEAHASMSKDLSELKGRIEGHHG